MPGLAEALALVASHQVFQLCHLQLLRLSAQFHKHENKEIIHMEHRLHLQNEY